MAPLQFFDCRPQRSYQAVTRILSTRIVCSPAEAADCSGTSAVNEVYVLCKLWVRVSLVSAATQRLGASLFGSIIYLDIYCLAQQQRATPSPLHSFCAAVC